MQGINLKECNRNQGNFLQFLQSKEQFIFIFSNLLARQRVFSTKPCAITILTSLFKNSLLPII